MALGHRGVMVTPPIGIGCETHHMHPTSTPAPSARASAPSCSPCLPVGLEGIVSKRLTAPYRSGRSSDWLKVKNPDSPAMVRARDGEW